MRITVAEDNALLRQGLELILGGAGHEITTAVDAAELTAAVAAGYDDARRPELVITDVRMPPTNTDEGLVAAVTLRGRFPDLPVLVLSQYVVHSSADRLLANGRGGVGYLLKDRITEIDRFLADVERIAAGETVIDPVVVAQLMARTTPALAALTDREREVLEAMARGLTNRAIATELVISAGAVEKHVARIFDKLGLAPNGDENRRVLAVLQLLGH